MSNPETPRPDIQKLLELAFIQSRAMDQCGEPAWAGTVERLSEHIRTLNEQLTKYEARYETDMHYQALLEKEHRETVQSLASIKQRHVDAVESGVRIPDAQVDMYNESSRCLSSLTLKL